MPDPVSDSTPATAAGRYVYGVAHMANESQVSHYKPHRDRADAEDDLEACRVDGADCYLIRAPADPWERVPHGE